jgi:hypothetical protein
MENITGCLVCGEDLVYSSEYNTRNCYYCGGSYSSSIYCRNDHFVCDKCHASPAAVLIENYCVHSSSTDPVTMATELMKSPKITMHGPEHHFLVPAVLISAYCNKVNDESKAAKIAKARKRAEKIPGGFCGTHGNCGAGVGAGIFISIMTGATSLSGKEWNLSNLITGRSLVSIASHGGPRCCKRDVYLALYESVAFLKEKFNVELEAPEVKCLFSGNNRECLKDGCPYHGAS